MTQREALREYHKAIRRGQLTRADVCEVCGETGATRGHHWKGYDYPLDVWWVCRRCNSLLWDKHDGSLASPADAVRHLEHRAQVYASRRLYTLPARLAPQDYEHLKEIAEQRGISLTMLMSEIVGDCLHK